MKKIIVSIFSGCLVFLLCSCASTTCADFSCKLAACYGNFDSCARDISASLADPEVRAELEKTPAAGAYYHQMLAVAELNRGMIANALTEFETSLAFQPLALTYFFRARYFLREGKNAEAADDIAAMEDLLSSPNAAEVAYYQFLLALLPGESHDEMLQLSTWDFLQSRLDHLKARLEVQKAYPPGILPVFQPVDSRRFAGISYGMTYDEMVKQLGPPSNSYPVRMSAAAIMNGPTAYVYRYPEEGIAVEFRYSPETRRLGDILLFPADIYLRRGSSHMPVLRPQSADLYPQDSQYAPVFRPEDAPYLLGTYGGLK